jgi:hypothetical protein
MAYATLSQLKNYLRGAGDDVPDTHDDILNSSLSRSQDIIERNPPLGTGRVFEASSDTTRYFDAEYDTHGLDLLFPQYDLATVTTVTVNGDTLSSSDYITIPRNRTPYYGIRIKRNSGEDWSWEDDPEDAIAVTGKWAYSTSAPDAVVHLTLRLAAYLYRQREFSQETDRPIIADGVTILPSQLPNDIRAMIKSLATTRGR